MYFFSIDAYVSWLKGKGFCNSYDYGFSGYLRYSAITACLKKIQWIRFSTQIRVIVFIYLVSVILTGENISYSGAKSYNTHKAILWWNGKEGPKAEYLNGH